MMLSHSFTILYSLARFLQWLRRLKMVFQPRRRLDLGDIANLLQHSKTTCCECNA